MLGGSTLTLLTSVLATLSGATEAQTPAGGERATDARTWTVEHRVSQPGTYDVVVSVSRPRQGKSNVVQVFVEQAGRRTVTTRPSRDKARSMRVRVRAEVADGTLSARVVGRRSRPRARLSVRRVATADPPATPAPAAPPAAEPPPAPTEPLPSALVWSDEFDGQAGAAPDPSRWDPQAGGNGWGNQELQSYTKRPANASHDGSGNLAIVARRETYTGSDGHTRDYTSARLQTKGRFSFTYGRVEARLKLPAGQGLWPAFWALGDDIYSAGWPRSGEIDVMEVLGQAPSTLHGTVHGPTESGGHYAVGKSVVSPTSLAEGFHVYGVIWRPDSLQWTLDGTVFARAARGDLPAGARWVYDHPFHLLLNLAVGGSWPGAPDPQTPFPASMLVDWVRVYQ